MKYDENTNFPRYERIGGGHIGLIRILFDHME